MTVKVTPGNQWLLPASPTSRRAGKSGSVISDALAVIARRAVSERVDGGDRIGGAEDPVGGASEPALIPAGAAQFPVSLPNRAAVGRDSYGNALPSIGAARGARYLDPAEQYARTQRSLDEDTRMVRVDVHA